MGSSINIFGLVVKGTNITMNRLNEIRSYLAMNEEIEFSYKGLECYLWKWIIYVITMILF